MKRIQINGNTRALCSLFYPRGFNITHSSFLFNRTVACLLSQQFSIPCSSHHADVYIICIIAKLAIAIGLHQVVSSASVTVCNCLESNP